MSNSLRAEITHLFKKGKITRPEYDWFMKKAYGHDDVIKKIAYQQGRADKEAEIKPLLKAIRFVLEDYSIRLGDYAKVIDEKLKENRND